jgi:hypothetical protein
MRRTPTTTLWNTGSVGLTTNASRKSNDSDANTWWPSVEKTPTEFHKDFRDLCALLNAAKVEFLIVGGYAVAFHGAPRFTGDLDILIRPDRDQVSRMLRALADFGFPSSETSPDHLFSQNKMLQLGRIPVQAASPACPGRKLGNHEKVDRTEACQSFSWADRP